MVDDTEDLEQTYSKPAQGVPAGGGPKVVVAEEQPGRYVLPAGVTDAELGRGGMGRVLRLSDTHLGRDVAVKELLPQHHPDESSDGPMMAEIFIREARVLARLEHPGVVPVYELARRVDGTIFYAMKHVRGRPLSAVLESAASLGDRLALLPHYLDVVQTVGFAHSKGVVHRDLKPANVMVGEFGETQVLDWGLALVAGEPLPGDGVTAGTPVYMSPEQGAGGAVDARSDVWSLGVMLFELLTGRRPFEGTDISSTLVATRDEPMPQLRGFEPRAPRALVAIVERALSKDPGLRFSNAGAMADALEVAQRARDPRPVGWMAAALAAVVVAAVASAIALRDTSRSTQFAHDAAVILRDAEAGRAQALAEAALTSLRGKDGFTARTLAARALATKETPLGRGVWLLAGEGALPEKLWATGTEAGCAQLVETSQGIACATLNGVVLYDAATGAEGKRLSQGPLGWQHAVVSVGPTSLAAAGDDRVIRTFDVVTGKASALPALSAPVTALARLGDGFVAGLRSGEVVTVSATGEMTPGFRHPSMVLALASRGEVVASASTSVTHIDAAGAPPITLARRALALTFSGPGELLLGVERTALLFKDGVPQRQFAGHRDDVTAVAKGAWVVTGAADGVLRWWYDDGSLAGQLEGFSPGVQAVLPLEQDPTSVVVATRARGLSRWRLPLPNPRLPEDSLPTAHAATRGGEWLTGLRDGRVRRVLLKSREVVDLEVRHDGPVRALAEVPAARSPEALRHLTGGDDGTVRGQRWNGQVETLDSHAAHITAVAVSKDATRAAWAWDDGTVVLYSLEAMREVTRSRAAVVRALAFSADGARLALGRVDKQVVLVNAQTGAELSTLGPSNGAVLAVAFSPSAEVLVSAGADGALTAWSVKDGTSRFSRRHAAERVTSLDVSSNGALLAAGSDDGSVYVYRLEDGVLWAHIPADGGDVLLVHFDATGVLWAAGTDRVVHRWPLAP